ncbi:protein NDRG3-like [Limulus polyphemus]|uniref:Protein NDRG3-like n=1 Tax=Limulus polyphemus TaxID=6850 RepID=A0ABM1BE22_LIMPO|nr:protein NDRG3-like [Limulus polyphemus]XP_022247959.1 protein NDRG3-like [Limulus polyphemus]XP_022247960.1 protein NDRG3-like [Limulus polyphemus]
MPSDMIDHIELKGVELQLPLMRNLSNNELYSQEDKIETETGTMFVAVQGEQNKPAIITYHDLGLDCVSNFQSFFNYVDMRVLLRSFCVYHINAPGQEEGAPSFPEGYVYPTVDQLAEMVLSVVNFYNLKHFVGLGVGAGANILAKFALQYPDFVDGLFLVNCTSRVASWTEWGYQKINAMYLRSSGMTSSALEYLLWHHFGKVTEERNHDLIQVYREYFSKSVKPLNLSLFIDSYIRRTDLNIQRELDTMKKKSERRFKCQVLLLVGALSPHLDDTIEMNGRLDPTNSSWMKLSDCGMALEEQPGKVSEVLRLFLQGLGFALNQFQQRLSSSLSSEAPSLSLKKLILSRQHSLDEQKSEFDRDYHQNVHIVENPIDMTLNTTTHL